LAQWLGAADERVGYTYVLRVLGFVLILVAVLDKNFQTRRRMSPDGKDIADGERGRGL
jgi:hypothetical protein